MPELRVCIIIPARYGSSRLPGKPLVKLLGRAMVLRVAELAAKVIHQSHVFVATDHHEIAEVVTKAGFKVIYTDSNLLTGTDRVAVAAQTVDYDIVINIQGDEPCLDPGDIKAVIKAKIENPRHVINGFCLLDKSEDVESVNIPKVVVTESTELVYMSRQVIPGSKDMCFDDSDFFKQVCIYAFTPEQLRVFNSFGRKSTLEAREDIEILRFLDLGIPVKMKRCSGGSFAVDVIEDIPRVESRLRDLEL